MDATSTTNKWLVIMMFATFLSIWILEMRRRREAGKCIAAATKPS
jgi:hypothetical protein